jgi:hypothetical protein
MNIDFLSNIVESADVSTFRTIASVFLRSVGYPKAFLSDGPYDGGSDFFVHKDPATGIETAFQLSIEKDWKKKLLQDIRKAKANYPSIGAFVFMSKRRIPLHSIQKVNTSLVQSIGLSATHYDNQAIATEFIERNLVPKLYDLVGIQLTSEDPPKSLASPKSEATAALLLFSSDGSNFRSDMLENLLSAELLEQSPAKESEFVESFLQRHNFSSLQAIDVARHIARGIENGKFKKYRSILEITEAQKTRMLGIRNLARGEFAALKTSVTQFLETTTPKIPPKDGTAILKGLLELSLALWRRTAPHRASKSSQKADETYHAIYTSLTSALGEKEAKRAMTGLAEIVSRSTFVKNIASSELFYSMLRTNSQQVVSALGGHKGMLVIFDTPVAIPILCGLLFDPIGDHWAYSARLLIDLLRQHKFTAVIPSQYLEECAAHLIDCCRNYQPLLLAGEDLSFSTNAFASHYSQLMKLGASAPSSFDAYIKTFGSPPGRQYSDLSDEFFFSVRDKLILSMRGHFNRYGVGNLSLPDTRYYRTEAELSKLSATGGQTRAGMLVTHDAQVIGHLEGTAVEAGVVKVLCTWDSVHFRYNPNWETYCVMNPAALTDLTAVARADEKSVPMAQLIDYVWMQSEASLKNSAQVWDEIVRIEKGNLSDAALLSKASDFRQDYVAAHQPDTEVEPTDVRSRWLQWKGRNA